MVQLIMTLCSVCYAQGNEVDADSYEPIQLPGMNKPRFIHLCEPCAKEVIGPLREALDEYGEVTDKTPPPVNAKQHAVSAYRANNNGRSKQNAGTITCPIDGCGYPKPLASRAGMRGHFKNHHDIELADWEGRQGVTVDGRPVGYYCEVDGCPAGFPDATGRGAHHSKRHGMRS